MSTETQKAVFGLPIGEGDKHDIAYIACGRNLTGQNHLKRSKKDKASWDALFADGASRDRSEDEEALYAIPDLPQELTFLEIDTALPKLSPLPMSGGAGSVLKGPSKDLGIADHHNEEAIIFTSRASLDSFFPRLSPADVNSVEVTLVGTDDGCMHLFIYDILSIGAFDCDSIPGQDKLPPVQLCCHASHPEVSTHSLLLQPRQGEANALYLVPMDLRFVSYSPVNLPLIAHKTTLYHTLLRYIKQTYIQMKYEWKSTRELPSRLLQGITEDLQSMPRGSVGIVQALFHTVVTGHVYPCVKEWLVDSLAERVSIYQCCNMSDPTLLTRR